MARNHDEVDQIVFRWDSENVSGTTGFGPVAWSGGPEDAEALFRGAGTVLRATGDETRPALIRLQRPRGGEAVLIRRLPFTDPGGGASAICHALVGSPDLLEAATCLGLHAWTWQGADLPLAQVRGKLPRVGEDVLLPAAGAGQAVLDERLPDVADELVGAVAELLRGPDDRFTLLDEPGDTALPVLWGLYSMLGSVYRRWSFATHDTAELPVLRFVFISRWAGAASRNTDRRRADPRERVGDTAESVANRLVHHHLRGLEEGDNREFAVSAALRRSLTRPQVPLLSTAQTALTHLDRAFPAKPSRRPAAVPPEPAAPPASRAEAADQDRETSDGRRPGVLGTSGRRPADPPEPAGESGGSAFSWQWGPSGGASPSEAYAESSAAQRAAEAYAETSEAYPETPSETRRAADSGPEGTAGPHGPDRAGGDARTDGPPPPRRPEAVPTAGAAPQQPPHRSGDRAASPWAGPVHVGRRVRLRRRPGGRTPGLSARLAEVRTVGEARDAAREGVDAELLVVLRNRALPRQVVTVLVQEIAQRFPGWGRRLRQDLRDLVLAEEYFVTRAHPGDQAGPAERAADAVALHRWAVRPVLGTGKGGRSAETAVAELAHLLARFRTSPQPAARAAYMRFVKDKRVGLPDDVMRSLLVGSYPPGRDRPPDPPGPGSVAPAPAPGGSGSKDGRVIFSVLVAVLVAVIVVLVTVIVAALP
ncbi:hypothetical protein ACIGEZ_15740 [Streptomyces sp. NPDC085481]|uniref:hypothetical protein n=1 Tax=Streptomyces sp. NPDC085481 TaxID=3365727 RepID=UPI0037D3CC7E